MSKGFTYTLQIDAEINDLVKKLELVKNSMKTAMDAGKAPGAEKTFTKIETAIEKLKEKTSQPIVSLSQFEAIKREVNGVETQFKQLSTITEKIASMDLADKMDLLPPDLKAKIEQADQAIKLFNTSLSKAEQKSEELITAEKNLANAKNELVKAEGKVQAKKSLVAIQEQAVQEAQKEAKAINEKKQALEKFLKTQEAYEKAGGDKRKAGGGKKELKGQNLPADRAAAASAVPGLDLKDTKAVQAEIARLQQEYLSASKAVTDAENTQRRYNKQLNEANNVAQITRDKVSNLENTVETLNTEFEKNKATNVQAAYTKLRTEAGKLGIDLKNIPIDYTEQNLQELNECLNRLATAGIAKVDQDIDNLQTEFEETGNAVQNLGSKMQSAGTDVEQLDQKVKSGEAFAQRLRQFVGLEGGIQIARRAMQRAMETIKELDAQMTEMAVVTDLEIGDYWNQLAEHTERASALGLAIKDVYEAETLYYQQGLKTNEVTAMSTETLKMARIAGLSAEDATNKMTAALRGFNMELNEMSAQRVADVYSELAAITASDVNEISEAMTKTASIASSAGMEFETTAAFLSQIIETTRESAETAGTAMKTVIARFQELKKDPAEIGEIDGEIVDANQIETALRSVGVALRDTTGQFRDLDAVFLELASKWAGLDTNTQRYIATIAAGSRQQSRFIAMMQDYERTQELVSAANDSSGASNQQFEKTLDSLETKLNQLKNAWDTFVMGITDSTILKAGIDILTWLMNMINGLIGFFDELHLGGVASIGLIVGALYLGSKALEIFGASLKANGSIFGAFGAVGKGAIGGVVKAFKALFVRESAVSKLQKTLNASMNKSAGSSIKLAAATEQVNVAKRKLEELEKKRIATGKLESVQDEELAAAKANLTLAEKNLSAVQTANKAVKKETVGIQSLGISQTYAEILALNGHTKEEIEALVVQEMANGASAEEARQRVLNTFGLGNETLAMKLNNKVREKGVWSMLYNLGLRLMGKKATDASTKSETANTAAKGASTGATVAQTAANIGLMATLWPILLATLAIIAALGVLAFIIVRIVAAFKNWKASQPDAQLEALREKTEKAKKATEAMKEEYEELLSQQEEYKTLIDTVENLTKGTTAWKEAVSKLNEQVLKLTGTYQELIKYTQMDSDGILSISDEGWDNLIEKQQQKVSGSQFVYMQAQWDVMQKQKEIGLSNVIKKETVYRDSGGNRVGESTAKTEQGVKSGASFLKQGYTEKQEDTVSGLYLHYQEDALALSKLVYGTEEYNRALLELRGTIKDNEFEQLAIINTLDETMKQLSELTEQSKIYQEQSLISSGSIEAQASENYYRIIKSMTGEYENINKLAEKESEKKWEQGKSQESLWTNGDNSTNQALKEEMLKYQLIATGNEKKDLASLLAAKGGTKYTPEEISDMGKGADNQIAEELKAFEEINITGEYVDEVYELSQYAAFQDLYEDTLDMDIDKIESNVDALTTASEIAKAALKNQIDIVRQARKDIDLEIEKVYKNLPNFDIAKAFGSSYDNRKNFLNTYQEMMRGAGQELADSFAFTMPGLSIEEQADFFEDYKDVDWTSSIDGAAALNQMLENGNTQLKLFAQSSLELENNFYSATAQANEFYNSLSEDTLKDLASDGKIAAGEILELAKSNEILTQMMDNTGVSAATLGKYYELIEKGILNSTTATDDFIRILDKLNAAANTIENSFAFLDNFEASRSGTEIAKGFGDLRNSMLELYNTGAYGDQALQEYIEVFVGADRWAEIIEKNGNDMKAAMEQVMLQVKEFSGNFQTEWLKLAESKAISGVSMGEDGNVLFDFTKITSVEVLKSQLIEQGWSEELADAMIADAQTFGLNIKEGLKTVDVKDAFIEWLVTSVKQIGDTKIIDESQFKAFIQESGLNEKTAKKALAENGIEIKKALKGEALEDWIKESILTSARAKGSFDIQQGYQLMLDLGLNDTAAKKQLAALTKEMQDVEFTLNEETVKGAGAELGSITYQGIDYGSTEALIDSVQDEKVKASQKKAALDQATVMGKAMAAASISASNVGSMSMATGLESVINGFIDGINAALGWMGVDIGHVKSFSNAVTNKNNQEIATAVSMMDSYFASDYAAVNKVLNSSSTGVDQSAAKEIYSYIEQNSQNPTSGTAYSSGTEVYGSDTDGYKSSYDWLFMLNQSLEDSIRKREKIERKYEKILERENTSYIALMESRNQYLNSLTEEKERQQSIITGAKNEQQNIKQDVGNSLQLRGLLNYLTFEKDQFGNHTGEITLSSNYATANISSELRETYDEYIDQLLELEGTIKDAEDSIEDIDDTIQEEEERGKDEIEDLYDRVKDAIVQDRQKQIDLLSDINNSIQSAQEQLVSKIQEQIDGARQSEENEEKKQNIADKEARLAYLMQDTSGLNALEILSLQKEIDEEKQDFSDSLIDQSIEKLQDANEKAAEQREKQIELAENQLKAYENSTQIWNDVADIVSSSLEAIKNGQDPATTTMGKLLYNWEVVEQNLNPFAEQAWFEELNDSGSLAAIYGMALRKELNHSLLNPTIPAYKDGGVADFTGPAWLDGTKTKPEMVLNQQDTANFIILKDILSEILNGTSSLSKSKEEKTGDNYFDIDISVDTIGEDYDVEQLADKIRSMIYEDASYRNVNTINNLR